MLPDATETVSALGQICGARHVFSEAAELAPFLSEPRRRFHRSALAAVAPGSVAEVQAIAAWANEKGVALVPQGGNTGLVGGQVPFTGGEVIVSLRRLKTIRVLDADAGTLIAEAGVTLHDAQSAADAAGQLLPLSLASEGSAQIGGVLSTNAGGVQVLAYGTARALCLGVKAVLADGRLYRGLSTLRKDNTGYDLKDLLVGAEGTLGIITAAALRLFPRPEARETAIVNVASPAGALTLFRLMRDRAGATLTAFELMPRLGVEIQLRHGMIGRDPTPSPSPWHALIEVSRPQGGRQGVLLEALEVALGAGMVSDAVVAPSEAARREFWALREQMSECQSREGASIKHDVSVPLAAVPRLIEEGTAAAARAVPGIRPVPFGHMGDGNIHFNFSQPVGADGEAFMAGAEVVHDAVHAVVARLGGSISAEHGIGQLKTGLLR